MIIKNWIILFIVLLCACSVTTEPKKAVHEEKTKNYDMLINAVKSLNNKWPDSLRLGIYRHEHVTKNKVRCLEYTQSNGLLFLHNRISNTGFIEREWHYRRLRLFAVNVMTSDIFDNNGKLLEKYYKRGKYKAPIFHNEVELAITADLNFGPTNIERVDDYHYTYIENEPNDTSFCFSFEKKNNTDITNNPVIGNGYIYIDKKTKVINKITYKNINYNSIIHGNIKKFGAKCKADKSLIIVLADFEGVMFYKEIKLSITWKRDKGVCMPPRDNWVDNELMDKEYLIIDKLLPSSQSNNLIGKFNKYPADCFYPVRTNYTNDSKLKKVLMPKTEFDIYMTSLSTNKDIKEQFIDNSNKELYSQFVNDYYIGFRDSVCRVFKTIYTEK